MAKSISQSAIEAMRGVVGNEPSEMELIRALHLAKNDVAKAVNFFFDDTTRHVPPPVQSRRQGSSPASRAANQAPLPRPPPPARPPPQQGPPPPVPFRSAHSSIRGGDKGPSNVGLSGVGFSAIGPGLGSSGAGAPGFGFSGVGPSGAGPFTISATVDTDAPLAATGPPSAFANGEYGSAGSRANRTVMSKSTAMPLPMPCSTIQQEGPSAGWSPYPSETDPPPPGLSHSKLEPGADMRVQGSGPGGLAREAGFLEKATERAEWTEHIGQTGRTAKAERTGGRTSSAVGSDSRSEDADWLLLNESQVCALSTCKGAKLETGDDVLFSFPRPGGGRGSGEAGRKLWGKLARGSSNNGSEIVRFSTAKFGEIGRMPGDLAKALIPLVGSGKVKVEASCLAAPPVLSIMDDIHLNIRVYVSAALFSKASAPSMDSASALLETSTLHPLSSLMRLFQMEPHHKAEFTPEDFYKKKRSLALDDRSAQKTDRAVSFNQGAPPVLLPPPKRIKVGGDGAPGSAVHATTPAGEGGDGDGEVDGGEAISDEDVTRLVGTSDADYLEEREASGELVSDLRPYQKQALWWMHHMETGNAAQDAAQTLHPCWEAYHLADRNRTPFYHNVFSGEATLKFPSALQKARGGILADSMGLGKTVMTISLLLTNKARGGEALASRGASPTGEGLRGEDGEASEEPKVGQKGPLKRKKAAKGGGTLIVCPMTLLSQWKAEIEAHTRPGALTVYAYYGSERSKERGILLGHDVVLTTYGVLASECAKEDSQEAGPVHSIHWHRVVLDEAHSIKAIGSKSARAVFQLTSDCRWCLTGTPIQNQLEDLFSLLHFLRVEPWSNYGWWTKLIQKPYEEGDERSLRLLQALLRPLMLRRTKESTDRHGRPILELPPSDVQVLTCHLSEYERDFYDALHEKSKVKFNQYVQEGRVLHNYASILELLLRMRQCCDHPFLVLSRGDTAEYADLNKLARRFLTSGKVAGREGESSHGSATGGPTAAYVKGVVEQLKKGESSECLICMEVMEDAVFTPCAHQFCRECLLTSWKESKGGLCPLCRQYVVKQELITAPKENRFQVDVETNWKDSSKVTALLQCLEEVRPRGEKSVVFSQWTAFLDLLQIPLKRKKFNFVRLDGTMSQPQRAKSIEDFRTRPDVQVMLISLKAGGVGINLTAATNAFLLDPWWNPAVEEQAIMRIHRIGQTRPVCVRRFIVKDSVEERMQAVQARKQRLVNGALTDEEVRSARIEELKMLFR